MARRSTPLLNLALALGSSLLVIALAEGTARLFERRLVDPEGEKLALWDKEWGDDYYVLQSRSLGWPPDDPLNRHGLPDRAHPVEKQEGVYRVVVLGDSVTAGTPFQPRRSYPYALQALHDERSPWTEIVTVALWGWSTRQERYAWDRIGRQYRPDLVVLAVCLNDLEELQNNLSRPPALLGWLHRRSAFVRRVVNADARSIRNVEELLVDSPNTTRAFARFRAELERLEKDVRAAGARLELLVLPMEKQVAGGTASRLPQERIAALAGEQGLRVLDPLAFLRARAAGRGLFEDVVHLSEPGRALLAEFLLQAPLVPEEARTTSALARELESRRAGRTPRRAEDSLAALLSALSSATDFRARAEAAWSLARHDGDRGDVTAALVSALADQSEAVRAEAARALGRMAGPAAGSGVVAALSRALEDPREAVRWRAIEALVVLAPAFEPTWPHLRRALHSSDAYLRAGAAWFLHERGDSARGATEELLPLLDDAEPGVRIVAVRALGALGGSDPRALARLQTTLRDPSDGDARRAAARALARLGPAARGATPALVAALRDANGHVRREAAAALGRIGSADDGVIEALVAATRDDAGFVRAAAAVALGRLGAPPPARPALERLLRDEEGEPRDAARRALERTQDE